MLVLLVVLGTVLFVRSRSGADTTATSATSTTVATPTATTAPPLPSSSVPAPTTPPPSTAPPTTTTQPAPPTRTTNGTPAGPADVSAITALSQQLIDALNSGDAKKIQGLTCGKLRKQADQGAQRPKKKITYDRTEDVKVGGDAGTAEVYASNDGTTPTPLTMEVQRVDGTWKACNLR